MDLGGTLIHRAKGQLSWTPEGLNSRQRNSGCIDSTETQNKDAILPGPPSPEISLALSLPHGAKVPSLQTLVLPLYFARKEEDQKSGS